MVYQFHNENLPTELKNIFKFSSDAHSSDAVLKSVKNNWLHVPPIITVTYGNKSLKFHCTDLWNELFKKGSIAINSDSKDNIKLCDIHRISHFSSILKKHYLYNYSLTDD